MRQEIRRFRVGPTAKVLGVLYTLVGLVVSPIFLLAALVAPDGAGAGVGVGLAVAMPILYGFLGFVFTAIGCLIYNMVAGWIGGIELEIVSSPSDSAV